MSILNDRLSLFTQQIIKLTFDIIHIIINQYTDGTKKYQNKNPNKGLGPGNWQLQVKIRVHFLLILN